jgi:hypothetical protein
MEADVTAFEPTVAECHLHKLGVRFADRGTSAGDVSDAYVASDSRSAGIMVTYPRGWAS